LEEETVKKESRRMKISKCPKEEKILVLGRYFFRMKIRNSTGRFVSVCNSGEAFKTTT
jgi:hypothetical protein